MNINFFKYKKPLFKVKSANQAKVISTLFCSFWVLLLLSLIFIDSVYPLKDKIAFVSIQTTIIGVYLYFNFHLLLPLFYLKKEIYKSSYINKEVEVFHRINNTHISFIGKLIHSDNNAAVTFSLPAKNELYSVAEAEYWFLGKQGSFSDEEKKQSAFQYKMSDKLVNFD